MAAGDPAADGGGGDAVVGGDVACGPDGFPAQRAGGVVGGVGMVVELFEQWLVVDGRRAGPASVAACGSSRWGLAGLLRGRALLPGGGGSVFGLANPAG